MLGGGGTVSNVNKNRNNGITRALPCKMTTSVCIKIYAKDDDIVLRVYEHTHKQPLSCARCAFIAQYVSAAGFPTLGLPWPRLPIFRQWLDAASSRSRWQGPFRLFTGFPYSAETDIQFFIKNNCKLRSEYNMRIVPVKMKFSALSRFPHKSEAVFYRRRLANLPR